MKVRNKESGEIQELTVDSQGGLLIEQDGEQIANLNSLAELNEEWEDYEEPKEYWYIDTYICERNCQTEGANVDRDNFNKEIGNYFETKEEAEKAVEKLKAWKRLKDKGFKVDLWDYDGGNYQERIKTGRILFRVKDYEENDKDLDLLFGSEK